MKRNSLTGTTRIVGRDVGPYRDRAVYSADWMYRYEFHREWADTEPATRAVWVLLNPATGDTDGKQRSTLSRCTKWSRAWGYSGLSIVNLFAYRAIKPKDLLFAEDPVGPENDTTLLRVAHDADRLVAAWGANGRLLGRGKPSRPNCHSPSASAIPRAASPGIPFTSQATPSWYRSRQAAHPVRRLA